jgi:hypothetical protein
MVKSIYHKSFSKTQDVVLTTLQSIDTGGITMVYWATIVLLLAFAGTAMDIAMGSHMALILNDIVLFLVALGMLIRIRYMNKRGEKEILEQKLAE